MIHYLLSRSQVFLRKAIKRKSTLDIAGLQPWCGSHEEMAGDDKTIADKAVTVAKEAADAKIAAEQAQSDAPQKAADDKAIAEKAAAFAKEASDAKISAEEAQSAAAQKTADDKAIAEMEITVAKEASDKKIDSDQAQAPAAQIVVKKALTISSEDDDTASDDDTNGSPLSKITCHKCGNIKQCSAGSVALFFMQCQKCKFDFCNALSCCFPCQQKCDGCAPEILSTVAMRVTGSLWWKHTKGEVDLPGSTEYRLNLLKDLEEGSYLEFGEQGQCIGDSVVGEDIMFWSKAIPEATLPHLQANLSLLPTTNRSALSPSVCVRTDSYARFSQKIVCTTTGTETPHRLAERQASAFEDDLQRKSILPPGIVDDDLLVCQECFKHLTHGVAIPTNKWSPSIHYCSSHTDLHFVDAEGNGPGDTIFLMTIKQEGWYIFVPPDDSNECCRVVHATEGSAIMFRNKFRLSWGSLLMRTDIKRSGAVPLADKASVTMITVMLQLGSCSEKDVNFFKNATKLHYGTEVEEVKEEDGEDHDTHPPKPTGRTKVTPTVTMTKQSSRSNIWVTEIEVPMGKPVMGFQSTAAIGRKPAQGSVFPVIKPKTKFCYYDTSNQAIEVHIVQVGLWRDPDETFMQRVFIGRQRPLTFDPARCEWKCSEPWTGLTIVDAMQVWHTRFRNMHLCTHTVACMGHPDRHQDRRSYPNYIPFDI